MKLYSEEKIINTIKNDEANYKIKLTSENILASYEASTPKVEVVEEKKKKSKRFKAGLFGGIGGALVLTAGILLVVFLNTGGNSILNPSDSITLTNELLTFASFNSGTTDSESSSLSLRKAANMSTINAKNDDYVTQETLEEIVKAYDEVSIGIQNIFAFEESVSIVTYDDNFTYEGINYIYRTDYIVDDEVVSSLYFNEIKTKEKRDETKTYIEALYYVDGKYYFAYIDQEIEYDWGEVEDETSVVLIGEDEYYRVEKESDSEWNESEECYIYAIYESERDAFRDNNPIYYVEYSIETENSYEEIELEIEDNRDTTSKTYGYQHIRQLSETSYRFYVEAEYESRNEKYEFEGYINLVINSDNSRTYTYNDISITLI